MRLRTVSVALAVVGVLLVVGAAVGVRALVEARPTDFPQVWTLLHGWQGDWRGPFVAQTSDADGLRIRDTFDKDRPRLRFETHDAAVARAFLDLVQIDERASGFGCTGDCCSGEYAIDVLRGSGVAVTLRITGGRALRSGALWPRDAALTLDSSEAVCAWLVAHGADVESPRKRADRIAAETALRDAAQDALLGRERALALRACPDDESAAARIAEWCPDAVDRIVLAVRFLALEPSGEPSGADDAGAGAYHCVERWLSGVHDAAALAAAFGRLMADDDLAPFAADRFETLDRGSDRPFSAETLPALRRSAARILLASSSEYSRECGVETLGRIGDTPEVRAILLGLLPPDSADRRAAAPPTHAQLTAATLVVGFCDPAMFPRLQALADAAKDDDARWSKRIAQRIAARRDPAAK